MFSRGKRLEAAEIRGCLALEKLTGLPGERRARRDVTCRILRASRPSISPLTDSRFLFLFVQWLSMLSLRFSLLSCIINIIVVYPLYKYRKNVNIELSLSYFLLIHLKRNFAKFEVRFLDSRDCFSYLKRFLQKFPL